jgi:uncharacterized Zn-finger protein
MMCVNCYDCLKNFDKYKTRCIQNQDKFKVKFEPSVFVEMVEEDNEDGVGIADEIISENNSDQEELDEEIVEYVDPEEGELKLDEAIEFVEEVDPENTSEALIAVEHIVDIINGKHTSNKSTSYIDSNEENKKGKEIYQRLLQTCPYCSKKVEKNRMEGHMNKHNDVRPYSCDECKKTFYCKQLLRLHKTSIHTDQSLECPVCKKTFPSARSLYSHSLRHKNQDRYQCELCEKRFNNSNSLKRHMAIHSGIREFVCALCGVGFYRKFNLDVHIKNVHEQMKEYSCTIEGCKKKFGYARLLKNHMKTHGIIDEGIVE